MVALNDGSRLADWTFVDVAGMILGEIGAREGAVRARRFVEHRHVRLDAMVIDKPSPALRLPDRRTYR
jgi:hypothetical protein